MKGIKIAYLLSVWYFQRQSQMQMVQSVLLYVKRQKSISTLENLVLDSAIKKITSRMRGPRSINQPLVQKTPKTKSLVPKTQIIVNNQPAKRPTYKVSKLPRIFQRVLVIYHRGWEYPRS